MVAKDKLVWTAQKGTTYFRCYQKDDKTLVLSVAKKFDSRKFVNLYWNRDIMDLYEGLKEHLKFRREKYENYKRKI